MLAFSCAGVDRPDLRELPPDSHVYIIFATRRVTTRTRALRIARPRGFRLMAAQLVDERCAARCADLAASLADCERISGTPAQCKPYLKRWREFCVTNSACNPAGRQQDPARAEKRCAALAKRVAICGASVDGQARPSATADCEEQRRRWKALCSSVRVVDLNVSDGIDAQGRSQAITQAYREAATRESLQPQHSGFMEAAADMLGGAHKTGLGRVICEHPVKAILAISAAGCGGMGYREATNPATAGLPLTQRLMHMRVYGQAFVVATTVSVMGMSEVLDFARRRAGRPRDPADVPRA